MSPPSGVTSLKGGNSGKQAERHQFRPQCRRIMEQVAAHPHLLRARDIVGPVVDEDRLLRPQTKARQRQSVNSGIGLTSFSTPDTTISRNGANIAASRAWKAGQNSAL